MKHDLDEKTHTCNNTSGISWSRVAIACGIVAASLLGLLYLDEAVTGTRSSNPYNSADPYAGYGIDAGESEERLHKLPQLVSSNLEPDSKTINATTGQLPLRKAIVLASFRYQNVDWLDELSRYSRGRVLLPPRLPLHDRIWRANTSSRWEVYRYVSDAEEGDDFLPVKNPNGREALPYLTFITDNYANLPDITVFSHGHGQSWHQPEPLVDKIMALNLSAVVEEDYVSLRCQQSHGCLKDDMFYLEEPDDGDLRGGKYIKHIWEELMEKEFGPIAPVIGRPCCAQFAVTRQAVMNRSLNFWNSLRTPLEERHEGMEGWRGKPDHAVGLKFEMFWHILFGKPPIHCPSRELCERVYFQDAIHCTDDGETFRGHDHWNEVKDDFECINDLRDD